MWVSLGMCGSGKAIFFLADESIQWGPELTIVLTGKVSEYGRTLTFSRGSAWRKVAA
jgi:hypothetical protein